MKRVVLNVLVGAFMVVAFTVCNSKGGSSCIINMTTEAKNEIEIYLYGSGITTVDWGDSSEKEILTLSEEGIEFHHTYSDAKTHSIHINGEHIFALSCDRCELKHLDVSKNLALTYLDCSYNQLTHLDVSKNTLLTYLNCSNNQLMRLDMSKNPTLTVLVCQANQLTADALNALFGTLHGNTIPRETKEISFYKNAGEKDCDRSIAIYKGWSIL